MDVWNHLFEKTKSLLKRHTGLAGLRQLVITDAVVRVELRPAKLLIAAGPTHH